MTAIAEKQKSVLFVCPSAYELTLVIQSEDYKDVGGRAIKVNAHRINFKKKPFGGKFRGEFLTSNQEEIDFIRQHDCFSKEPIPNEFNDPQGIVTGPSFGTNRKVYEVDFNPDAPRVVPTVITRMGEAKETKEIKAPEDKAPNPLKAKIPKLSK